MLLKGGISHTFIKWSIRSAYSIRSNLLLERLRGHFRNCVSISMKWLHCVDYLIQNAQSPKNQRAFSGKDPWLENVLLRRTLPGPHRHILLPGWFWYGSCLKPVQFSSSDWDLNGGFSCLMYMFFLIPATCIIFRYVYLGLCLCCLYCSS